MLSIMKVLAEQTVAHRRKLESLATPQISVWATFFYEKVADLLSYRGHCVC
jgi:hypothetical protein